jgi:dTDP-4-dehydrorhamnose 3,5-epimerase
MKYSPTPLKNAWVVEAEPIFDHRGNFVRFFCQNELREIHQGKPIAQMNYSITVKKGAVRGMHFQHPPKATTKLVRCLRGSVFDVIVDLRQNSPTFLQWHGELLSGENMKMLYIPEGFAHGFQNLEENCEMLYLHTEFYSPPHEGGIRYDDPKIEIKWPLETSEISERDQSHPLLAPDFSGIIL